VTVLAKIENHVASIALFHMHYNFARIHQTLRVTPAMEAKLKHAANETKRLKACINGLTGVPRLDRIR